MLTRLSVKNFKGLESLDLQDLKRFTLISGRNNSGKSSVLEAIFMALDIANPHMTIRHYGWRGVMQFGTDPDSVLAPLFYDWDLKRKITLTLGFDGGTTREMNYSFAVPSMIAKPIVSEDGKLVQLVKSEPTPASYALKVRAAFAGHAFDYELAFDSPNLTIKGIDQRVVAEAQRILAAIVPSAQRVHVSEEADRFGALDKTGKAGIAVDALKIVEPRLKGLSVIPLHGLPIIHADVGLGKKIPVPLVGEGMARLLSIVLAIAATPGGIVMVDEIENGLYFKTMPEIWEVIAKTAIANNVQVFATTHSHEMIASAIDGLPEVATGQFKFIRLDRDDDRVSAKTYSFQTLSAAIEGDIETR